MKRGCILDGAFGLRPCIPGGVIMATTAYAHLDDQPTQIFIALYTALLIFLDDAFQEDVELVASFNSRFIRKEPQRHANLDVFAHLLHEMPSRFSSVAANIMVTSTLNLVTALALEHEMSSMMVIY